MPTPTITPLPDPPQRGQSFDEFTSKANAHVGALVNWTTEVNSVAAWIDGVAVNIEDWAIKEGSAVSGSNWSAKEHAVGNAVSTGSAKNWAAKTNGYVIGTDNSARSWAVGGTGNGQPSQGSSKAWAVGGSGDPTTEGSAKAWATAALDTIVAGGEYSAKHHAQKAAESEAISVGAYNFKGLWSNLSGALNMPASVLHNGVYWVLVENLANVATATPGVNAAWRFLSNTNFDPVTASTVSYSDGKVSEIIETLPHGTRTITYAYHEDGRVNTITSIMGGRQKVETMQYSGNTFTGITSTESNV